MDNKDIKFGFGEIQYDGLTPISSITFGDGSLCITDVTVDSDGFSAVSISNAVENRGVGGDLSDLVTGQIGENLMPDLLLRFNNHASIDVLISKLKLAKAHLNNAEENNHEPS